MACRVPLVVSDRNFNRAFLDESCAVFTDPEDSGSIAAGLLTVFREPEAAARRAEEAFRRVARFSTAAKARAFLQFGREIVTAWQTASPSRNP
jgi:glycosyltransferase involved in cell wall biosynthesis